MTSSTVEPTEKQREPAPRRTRARISVSSTLWVLGTASFAVIVTLPILVYFLTSLRAGHVDRVMAVPDLGKTLFMTVFLAAASTIIGAVLAVLLAAAVIRIPGRRQSLAAVIPQLPLVGPPVAMVYGWIFLFSPGVGYGNTLLRMTPFFDHLRRGRSTCTRCRPSS